MNVSAFPSKYALSTQARYGMRQSVQATSGIAKVAFGASQTRPITILPAQYEPRLMEILQEPLKAAGFTVLPNVNNRQDFRKAYQKRKPDVILMGLFWHNGKGESGTQEAQCAFERYLEDTGAPRSSVILYTTMPHMAWPGCRVVDKNALIRNPERLIPQLIEIVRQAAADKRGEPVTAE